MQHLQFLHRDVFPAVFRADHDRVPEHLLKYSPVPPLAAFDYDGVLPLRAGQKVLHKTERRPGKPGQKNTSFLIIAERHHYLLFTVLIPSRDPRKAG